MGIDVCDGDVGLGDRDCHADRAAAQIQNAGAAARCCDGEEERVIRTPLIHRVVQVRSMFVSVCCLLMLGGTEDLLGVRLCLGQSLVDSEFLSRAARTGVADRGLRCDSTVVSGTMNTYHSSEGRGFHHVHQRKRGAQDPVPAHRAGE